VLDDRELQRVSTLARIELEDAKAELERAQNAARAMEQRLTTEEDEDDGDENGWVE
jgi:periodic tryptophan protein 1